MSTSAFDAGEYLTCPFDSAHKVLSDNFKHHITRCSQVSPSFFKYTQFLFFDIDTSTYQTDQMSFQWCT
jgi:hypothetical protein